LHGGGPAEVQQRRDCLAKMLKEEKLNPWERGVIIHALGDAYAHVDSSDGAAWSWPFGHGFYGHRPDSIGDDKPKYQQYVFKLYTALGGDGAPEDNHQIQALLTYINGPEGPQPLAPFRDHWWSPFWTWGKSQESALEEEAKGLQTFMKKEGIDYPFEYVPGKFNLAPDHGGTTTNPALPTVTHSDMDNLMSRIERYCTCAATNGNSGAGPTEDLPTSDQVRDEVFKNGFPIPAYP
jgi:hypothetical protein